MIIRVWRTSKRNGAMVWRRRRVVAIHRRRITPRRRWHSVSWWWSSGDHPVWGWAPGELMYTQCMSMLTQTKEQMQIMPCSLGKSIQKELPLELSPTLHTPYRRLVRWKVTIRIVLCSYKRMIRVSMKRWLPLRHRGRKGVSLVKEWSLVISALSSR